jgi:hypothetical protein
MNLTRSRTHWEDMGTLDPCWAILSEPMNYLPEGEVRAILEQNQCRVLMSVPDNCAGAHIASRTYYATKF